MAEFDTYFVLITFVFRLFNLTEIEFLFQTCLTCITIFLIYKHFDNYSSVFTYFCRRKTHLFYRNFVCRNSKLLSYIYFFNSVFLIHAI